MRNKNIASEQTLSLYKIFNNLDVNENTQKEYLARSDLFISFLGEHGFSKDSYLEYKRYLSQKTNWSVSTKNKYLVVARIYCKGLYGQGFIPMDITRNVKSFKQTRKHKKEGLSEEEVQKVLKYINRLTYSCDTCRIKVLLCLLILQGLRQIEIVRLQISDINLVSQTIRVQGKGMDDKEVIDLHPVTVSAIKDYLRMNKISDGMLIVSKSNRNKRQPVTTKTLRNTINPILKELKIDKTLHGFRHYFTTKLIQSYKGDLLTVAQYTRHKSIEMLQIYNDSVKRKADLPRYYAVFDNVTLSGMEDAISYNSHYKK